MAHAMTRLAVLLGALSLGATDAGTPLPSLPADLKVTLELGETRAFRDPGIQRVMVSGCSTTDIDVRTNGSSIELSGVRLSRRCPLFLSTRNGNLVLEVSVVESVMPPLLPEPQPDGAFIPLDFVEGVEVEGDGVKASLVDGGIRLRTRLKGEVLLRIHRKGSVASYRVSLQRVTDGGR